MDLPLKVSNNGDILAKYSYLTDGTKISAMDSTGTCYRYYGPMVYTVGINGNKSFESAAIAAGRITAGGVHYHMTDHLGSVKTVVSGSDGLLLEDSKYDVWGKRSDGPLPTLPVTSDSFRYHFTGKEDQSPAFGISYTDFGARHYSPNLRRWLVPDPLSEQYYDVSPYAYCAGDPVNMVDEDGGQIIPWSILYKSLAKHLENNGRNHNVRQLGYGMQHPVIALQVGTYNANFNNLTTISANFAIIF